MGRPTETMWRVKYGGLAVAAVGFGLSRYAVVASVRTNESVGRFLVGQGPFLALGLGLTAFGVALAVSRYTSRQVNTVAGWCLLGTGAMAAVLGMTAAEPMVYGETSSLASASGLVANVLVGGAVGGLLTGLRSAEARRQRRSLSNQADRLTVLNRILRHEVLNGLNVIRGYATLNAPRPESSLDTIRRSAERIEAAIDDVAPLTRTVGDDDALEPIPVRDVLRGEVAAAREAAPDAEIRLFDRGPMDPAVLADPHLGTAFGHLLDNAVAHNDAPRPSVEIEVRTSASSVAVHVRDDGPGLPAEQRARIRDGRLSEYDDPSTGFGLTVSQLLIERYGGRLRVDSAGEDGRGAELVVELRRAVGDDPDALGEYGVSFARLRDATVAALVAGVAMGLLLQTLFGSLAVIGALYGVSTAPVGWLTHLFHSVVFGVVFAAAVWRRPLRGGPRDVLRCAGAGLVYGALLWFVAAGLVMPLWLSMVGVPAPIPNLNPASLIGHLVWGGLLGGLYAALEGRDDPGSRNDPA